PLEILSKPVTELVVLRRKPDCEIHFLHPARTACVRQFFRNGKQGKDEMPIIASLISHVRKPSPGKSPVTSSVFNHFIGERRFGRVFRKPGYKREPGGFDSIVAMVDCDKHKMHLQNF